MRHFMYGVIALCALLICVSYAQAADAVAAAVQKRYGSIRTMQAAFSQVLVHQESGSREERTGVLYFAKPMDIRWETLRPIPEILLVTPGVVWNVFPDEDMAYKYPAELSAESAAIARVVTGQSDLEKDFILEDAGVRDGIATLTLYPKNPTQSMTEVTLRVAVATGLILQATVIDFFNNRNEITFTSQDMDIPLDASLFTFSPPAGMKVEDRTQSGGMPGALMP